MTSFRIDGGTLIDRNDVRRFTFNGEALSGFGGDTVASALLANGKQLVGRSFKYHRPRGILTAGAAEPNALLTIGRDGRRDPNTRATMAELFDGLEARSQNCWPNVNFDIGAANGLLGPLLGAGFYYKTFMWPAAFWEKVYEPLIRKAAGLGRASYDPDPGYYEKCWAHCDLLVIGAGPAGLAAALTAGRAGARVIVADEGAQLGGGFLAEGSPVGGKPADTVLADIIGELHALPNVEIRKRTTVFAAYDDQVFGAVERVQKHLPENEINPHRAMERLWRIVARQVVLATGAEERPIVFGGNDRPGVMMAGAMRTYLNAYGVAPGKRVALFANNSQAYQTAVDLEARGIEVAAIIDPRTCPNINYAGKARLIAGAMVRDTAGRRAIKSITVRHDDGSDEVIAVDALGVSGGYSPIVHLACHHGGKPVWSDAHVGFMPPEKTDGMTPCGAVAGKAGIAACFEAGGVAAVKALAELGVMGEAASLPGVEQSEEKVDPIQPVWMVASSKGKAFVDFQNDVAASDITLAMREGYDHVELAKRYTTNGMATDQGKTSNVNAIGILAENKGVSPGEIGTTTFRPFYTPVSFGALVGASKGMDFQPVRKSPLHGWAERNGAKFVETGLWYRSSWFPKDGETFWRDSVDREVNTVRTKVGICDVSTLGKIEIFGADAAEFLNRVYCNAFLKLPVGKARYGIMLREDGFVYDDGTTSCLGENHYFMTTTTALAAGVLTHLEFCAQVLWPELDVRLASATDQWAQMAIAGPKSREVLSRIIDDDISNEAFPFLAAREVSMFGGRLKGRLFRISFSGELAYEIAVPAGYGESVADAVMMAGEEFGIAPYGTEALGVMRIEKGHVTHAEINGTVTPADLGMGKMVSAKKDDFIGRVMNLREGLVDPDRLALVGIKPKSPSDKFATGSHILNPGDDVSLANDQGYVTSMCHSPTLGHAVGLALVKNGPKRHGEEVVIWNGLAGTTVTGILCDPAFVDPENEKLHA
ncbi:sarcosine oxidase subunit alpha family protein [Thalassospira tepidiphila]|jgi:heterotetrameric sarcosine oxidase alpha subunit|uniref:sarcosine oxidase subunit alpha family protein n=1 Tax=Thalassospira tepidiphila TaxID=393657 RepID=UPI001BD19535|nr:sarcosine oxidase subunit alpha family protein [Thalassospira tepidiphila]MBS8275684.1 sarcosine oxidase subunit alpha family protein [Thalassospira tepidiphila]